jgi:hypothetical protein
MAVHVDKTYSTEGVSLNYTHSSLTWELYIYGETIYLNSQRFEELKAVMAEVLHEIPANS